MTATTGTIGSFLNRVRALANDSCSDSELVREYAGSRSDATFAELVRRFGPMVWGVCRRTIGHEQSAEDAFQAVFLVLVRKAATIHPPSVVGGWLHGVAVNTSLRARAMIDRRRKRHKPLDRDQPEPALDTVESTDRDALRALDQEIACLPDKLRTAIVLCELDGLSRRDAAKRLGIAEGTLSSRLAAGRKQLVARLRSRGVALGVGSITALVNGTASAVPPVVVSASETGFILAEGAIRTMFLNKLKRLMAGGLTLVLLGLGLTMYKSEASEPLRTVKIRRYAPVPKAEPREGVIMVGVQDNDGKNQIVLLTPKGEKVATIPLEPHPMYHPALSRDCKLVAVWSWDSFRTDQANRGAPGQEISHEGTLLVFDVAKPDMPLVKLEKIRSVGYVFAPDAYSLYLNERPEPDPTNETQEATVYRLDLKTMKKEKIDVPPGHYLMDISPDGKTFLTVSDKPKVKGEYNAASYLVPLAALDKPRLLSEACVGCSKFSPDGTRVLGRKFLDPSKQELVILDVKDGKESVVKLGEDTYLIWNAGWSPDGKKLVVHRDVLLPGAKPPMPAGPPGLIIAPAHKPEVAIRELDGSSPRVLETKGQAHIFGIDWR